MFFFKKKNLIALAAATIDGSIRIIFICFNTTFLHDVLKSHIHETSITSIVEISVAAMSSCTDRDNSSPVVIWFILSTAPIAENAQPLAINQEISISIAILISKAEKVKNKNIQQYP